MQRSSAAWEWNACWSKTAKAVTSHYLGNRVILASRSPHQAEWQGYHRVQLSEKRRPRSRSERNAGTAAAPLRQGIHISPEAGSCHEFPASGILILEWQNEPAVPGVFGSLQFRPQNQRWNYRMSNRSYLVCYDQTDICADDDHVDDFLAEAVYRVPVLWLCLFRPSDLQTRDIQEGGVAYTETAPFASKADCLLHCQVSRMVVEDVTVFSVDSDATSQQRTVSVLLKPEESERLLMSSEQGRLTMSVGKRPGPD